MTALSRTKGKRGELEIVHLVADLTGYPVTRKVRQHPGDSDLEGLPGWSVEIKRAAEPSVRAWWEQTECQAFAAELTPVLFYRLDYLQWRAVWPLAIVMGADPRQWHGIQWTAETSVEAWAAVFAEFHPQPPKVAP